MKSFSMADGDVIISDTIEMVSDNELLRQKVLRVLGTNRGEWSYDKDEGIDFRAVLTKNPDKAEIRATLEAALIHIDPTFALTEFSMELVRRTATIKFTASTGDGEEVGGEVTYGN